MERGSFGAEHLHLRGATVQIYPESPRAPRPFPSFSYHLFHLADPELDPFIRNWWGFPSGSGKRTLVNSGWKRLRVQIPSLGRSPGRKGFKPQYSCPGKFRHWKTWQATVHHRDHEVDCGCSTHHTHTYAHTAINCKHKQNKHFSPSSGHPNTLIKPKRGLRDLCSPARIGRHLMTTWTCCWHLKLVGRGSLVGTGPNAYRSDTPSPWWSENRLIEQWFWKNTVLY